MAFSFLIHRRTTFLILFSSLLLGCEQHATPVVQSTSVAAPLRAVATSRPMPATTQSADGFPQTSNPRDTIRFLASDDLAGRLPGTPGLKRAGDFLAAEFGRIGLQPLPGRADYFQSFGMADSSSLAPTTHLASNGQMLVLGKDFSPMFLSAEKQFAGKIAFAGFCITSQSPAYDDFAGLDVKGKVVLAMMKEPLDDKNTSRFAGGQARWSNNALFTIKAKNAADHGAVALLLVAPPSSGGLDSVIPYGGDGTHLASIPMMQISRRVANLLLSTGNATDLKTIQDAIYTQFKPQSCVLPDIEINGNVQVLRTSLPVRNVMAYLPGTGPTANEWIIVGRTTIILGRGSLGT